MLAVAAAELAPAPLPSELAAEAPK